MSTNYPTSLDTFTNPVGTDAVATVDHAAQHSNANDSIAALETKVGITGSANTNSVDYKLSGVTGTDKAVSKTGSETLTNKTLTAPVISTITNTGTVTLPTATDTLVGKATTDALTNKTITDSTNNVMAKSLKSATTTVDVSAATAPSNGQFLRATSSTTATWQTFGGSTTFSTTQVFNGTAPTSLTTLDISAVVGVTQRMVMLHLTCTASAGFGFTRNAATGTFKGSTGTGASQASTTSGGANDVYVVVSTDTSGVIQWIANTGATTQIAVEAFW